MNAKRYAKCEALMALLVDKREAPPPYEFFALSREERHQTAEEQMARGCGQGGSPSQ
jgi:hypothetical protein